MTDHPPLPDSAPPPSTGSTGPRSRKGKLLALVLAAVGVALLVATLVPAETWRTVQATAQAAMEACRAAGPLPFFGAMAFLPAFGFPLSPFVLTAGPLFGPELGRVTVILCAIGAIAINATVSYWIAARLLRPLTKRALQWLGYTLPEPGKNSSWMATLLVRVVPGPPFFVQSYLLGLAGVPFGVYLIVSTLVQLGYVSAIVLFGDAIARGDRGAAIAAAGLLFVSGGIIHQLRRYLNRRAQAAK